LITAAGSDDNHKNGESMNQHQVLVQALAQAITAPDDDTAATAVKLVHTIADDMAQPPR